MAEIVTARSPVEAWRAAAQILLNRGPQNNLLIEINEPTNIDEASLKVLDPRNRIPRIKRGLHDVANTIFPQRIYHKATDRADLYGRYLSAFERGRTRPLNRATWGTYFQRMICFGSNRVNRLEQIIIALQTWKTTHRAAYYLHLSAQNIDPLKPLASPCLQYIQFTEHQDTRLDLVVVVRNHDYLQKSLGNFVGLGRLLAFVATETQHTPGLLICHSVHAYINGSRAELKCLLTQDD